MIRLLRKVLSVFIALPALLILATGANGLYIHLATPDAPIGSFTFSLGGVKHRPPMDGGAVIPFPDVDGPSVTAYPVAPYPQKRGLLLASIVSTAGFGLACLALAAWPVRGSGRRVSAKLGSAFLALSVVIAVAAPFV